MYLLHLDTLTVCQNERIPSLAAARLQRWALLLSTYDYNIHFKPTQEHGNADALSRLPLPVQDFPQTAEIEAVSVFDIAQIQASCNLPASTASN